MTTEELAWFAGLFEGEGTIFIDQNGKRSQPTPCIAVGMTDEDTIRTIMRTLKVGEVQGPYKGATANRKQTWRWRLRGKDAVERLGELILPWMSKRRTEQITRVLRESDETRRYARGTRGQQICIGLQ